MIEIGDTLPSVDIRMKQDGKIVTVSSTTLFAGKKSVLFSVPGAFTPTCSEKHVPGFIKHTDAILARCDGLYCIAVNDIFVLSAWEASLKLRGKITMLSDGNGEFARSLGADIDLCAGGLGQRMVRCAMIIDDTTIRWLGVDSPSEVRHASAQKVLSMLSS